MQRVADHRRVLVQLLLHEVAEIALADRGTGQPRQLHLALHLIAIGRKEAGALPVHHRPVAIVQIGDAAGQRRQRQRVGADEHLVLAEPNGQWRTMLRADDQLGMAREDHRERIGALQTAQRRPGRGNRIHAALQVEVDELRHRLGVRLGREFLPLGFQLGAQLGVILDDAVMDDGDARGAVRMRIAFGWCAMCRPPRVADPDAAGQRRALEGRREIAELPLGAAALDMAVHQGRDAGAVVAAIFEPPQRVQQQRSRRTRPDHSHDATHQRLVPCFVRCCSALSAEARPGFSTCRPRAIASASGATSSVMTLPAATIAPSPTETGATSAVSDPMKARSPMRVRCLDTPS
jgi:hypothetical protein